jgi:hypothetical protein
MQVHLATVRAATRPGITSSLFSPGNANPLIGWVPDGSANQEIGVPRRPVPRYIYPLSLQQIGTISTNSAPTIVLLPAWDRPSILPNMARYSALIGRRIVVTYRAGDILLPATGNLAADSGKSIFLEESYQQQGSARTFRWEIPYFCIVELAERPEIPSPSASIKESRDASGESTRQSGSLELKNRLA